LLLVGVEAAVSVHAAHGAHGRAHDTVDVHPEIQKKKGTIDYRCEDGKKVGELRGDIGAIE
jgi:hypothetical protein